MREVTRLGGHYWPDYDLGKAVEWAKDLITKKGGLIDEVKVVEDLRHKALKGDASKTKMTVLSHYGLIERKNALTEQSKGENYER